METLQRTANRGSVSTGPYQIDNSCKFERDNSESIVTTNQAAGNQKTWTFSAWIKRSRLSYDWDNIFGAGTIYMMFDAEDEFRFVMYDGTTYTLETNRKFRDTSAWYHIVVAFDTTQSTASNRAKLYVNGVQETSFQSPTYPNQNDTFDLGGQGSSANWIQLGRFYSGSRHFSGYMAEVHYLNGTAEDADAFGEYDDDSGIWIPKAYTGSGYGTQGFYYKFDNASNLGEDSSGEGHDANSLNNITAADQSTDTPTNNFCTWNPLYAMTYPMTISEGGTKTTANASVAQWQSSKASMAVNNGKWYWETSNFTELNTFIGIQSADVNLAYGNAYSWNLPLNDNSFYITDPNSRTESFATTKATTDVWAIALNMDDGEISFYRNGTQQNSTVSIDGLIGNGPYVAIISQYASAGTCSTNFGGYNSGKAISSAASDANGYGTFEYAPPTGYYALCSRNLSELG